MVALQQLTLLITCVSVASSSHYTLIPDIDVYSKETVEACKRTLQVPAGCSLQEACLEEKQKGICAPQSIWNDVCSDDAPGLRNTGICERYKTSCIKADKPALECTSGLDALPKSSEVRSLIKEMCSEMPRMRECKTCGGGDCDQPFLKAYVPLCASMPEMHECAKWRKLCTSVTQSQVRKAWSCAEDDNAEQPPPMRMYLHFSRLDYILFSWWVPRTNLSFFIAFIFCLFFGVLSSCLRIFRARQEHEWVIFEEQTYPGERFWLMAPCYTTNVKRAGLLSLVSTIDFLLMLIVMTFNVWLICAGVLGLGLGHFLFGHMLPKKGIAPPCCCAGE